MKTLCQVHSHTLDDRQCLCPRAVTISRTGDHRYAVYKGQVSRIDKSTVPRKTCMYSTNAYYCFQEYNSAPRKLHHRLSRVKKAFQKQLLLDYYVWPISDMGCTEHVLPPGQFFSLPSYSLRLVV